VRIFVRLLSALLGLVIAGVGVLVLLEVTWARWNAGHGALVVPWRRWRDTLGTLRWSDIPVQVTAGVVAFVGLLLLLAAARARRRDVRMYDPAPEVSVVTSRRSLARLVGHRLRATDVAGEPSVTASARRVKVRVDTRFHTAEELRSPLRDIADNALSALPVPRTPRVSVAVHSRLVTQAPAEREASEDRG
jgi:hypothetical protein